MTTLLQFISRISVVLYALAATGVFFALRSLIQARRVRRVAVFGLEREAATARFRRALSMIITLVFLSGVVYVIDNIVLPNTEPATESNQDDEPVSISVLTRTPSPTPSLLLFPTVTPTVGVPPAEVGDEGEGTDTAPTEEVEGCEIIGANISSPSPGDEVSGQVSVEGEVNVLNFSQYKFEIKGPATGDAWVVLGSYLQQVQSGLLGVWDSTSLQPGSYTLRLIVYREDGTFIPPCEVPITIRQSSTG